MCQTVILLAWKGYSDWCHISLCLSLSVSVSLSLSHPPPLSLPFLSSQIRTAVSLLPETICVQSRLYSDRTVSWWPSKANTTDEGSLTRTLSSEFPASICLLLGRWKPNDKCNWKGLVASMLHVPHSYCPQKQSICCCNCGTQTRSAWKDLQQPQPPRLLAFCSPLPLSWTRFSGHQNMKLFAHKQVQHCPAPSSICWVKRAHVPSAGDRQQNFPSSSY